MTSTFFADTNSKIRKIKNDGKYKVGNKLNLSLIKRGNSKYFVGFMNFPFNRNGKKVSVPLGSFEKEILVDEARDKWLEIKLWSKRNNKSPKLFEVEEKVSDKTFKEITEEYMETVYKNKVKEKVFEDRQNKLNQMLRYIGEEKLIADLEIAKVGSSKICMR